MPTPVVPLPSPERDRILWFGAAWPDAFKNACHFRNLTPYLATATSAAALWPSARTAIFFKPDAALLEDMREYILRDGLAHGLFLFIVAPANVATVRTMLNDMRVGDRVRIWNQAGLGWLPEYSARWDPGRAEKQPTADLKGCGKCSEEDHILLRRAFNDCSEVVFRDLTRDDRSIFEAYAKLRQSQAGPYPMPFLVKLDDAGRIRREMQNYETATSHFLPFYARPNLDPSRCLMGATRGLIVGNYVENAESLNDVVARGTAIGAINSLFEDALRGWRTQAYLHDSGIATGKLAPAALYPDLQAMAARRGADAQALGASLSAQAVADLIDALPPIRHRQALRHGDLHGDNVQVRAGQAILIDFLQVAQGPLVDDPAMLETSFALSFPDPKNESPKVLEELYAIENLRSLPPARAPTAPLSSLWNSVRQVRRFGLAEQLSEDEYARAVAVQLLRHAGRGSAGGKNALRRQRMFVLAERLALALSQAASTTPSSLAAARGPAPPTATNAAPEADTDEGR